jgi:integrase
MNDVVRETLTHLRKECQRDLVFPSSLTGRRLVDIKNAFRGACKEAGIRDFRFHYLRHTFGTRAADAGVPINAIADVMGHADIHTTQRYTHATDQGRRRAVDAAVVDPAKLVKIWSKRASGANSE